MRRLHLAASLALLCGAGCGTPGGDGALRLRVVVPQESGVLQPGCVRVLVRDAADASRSSEATLPYRGAPLTLAVYRPDGAGPELEVTAFALEQSCAGAPAGSASARATLQRGKVEGLELALRAVDFDGDGFGASGTDCADRDPARNPGAVERCNDVDDDCDGETDELPTLELYKDEDSDGHGAGSPIATDCSVPPGFSSRGGDCDDTRADTYPGAAELCDGRDNDCNGSKDDGLGLDLACPADGGCIGKLACAADAGVVCSTTDVLWYPDRDGDLRGRQDVPGVASCAPPDGGPDASYVPNNTDCNDADPTVFANAPELCDGKDNDCDNPPQADEPYAVGSLCDGGGCLGVVVCAADGGARCQASAAVTLYPDKDRDRHGAADGGSARFCAIPDGGWVGTADDCDDSNPAIRPGAAELCDGRDNDCSGSADEPFNLGRRCNAGCPGTVACAADGGTQCQIDGGRYYVDDDGDGQGNPDAGALVCGPPGPGFAANAADCDDLDPYSFGGAPEICDTRDNDCNGAVDEGACPADAGRWVVKPNSELGGGNSSWRTASSFGPGAVWVAGMQSRLRVRAGAGAFINHDGDCSGDWVASWGRKRKKKTANGSAALG